MKKLIALFVALVILLPVVGLADPADVSSMTDEELKEMISACSAELMKRNTNEPEGILIFEYEKVKVYQTGEPYLDFSGNLRLPVAVYNEFDHEMVISAENANCNGWDIYAGNCRATGNAKNKCEISFNVKDADVKAIDEINSLLFAWEVYDFTAYEKIYKEEERTEHRFW